MGTITQGQGHQTTYAQIIASELGIPSEVIQVEEGDTSTAPYGLGTYGSRSTPVAGAAIAMAARKIHAKAKKIAAHLLEVAEGDLDWEIDRFKVRGNEEQFKTWQILHGLPITSHPKVWSRVLRPFITTIHQISPPFGIYLCVVDIDKGTGESSIRRFYALDDCGTRINPMIIDGQIHGGLTEGFAVAMGQQMPFDEQGNLMGNTLMDYFLPTAVETPTWETDYTVTPSPHHPIGAKVWPNLPTSAQSQLLTQQWLMHLPTLA